MSSKDLNDKVEVIDLEKHACSGEPIPVHATYYRIKVDKEHLVVQTPITGAEVLASAGLEVDEYVLIQKLSDGSKMELDLDQPIDLRLPGIEKFKTKLKEPPFVVVNTRQKAISDKKLCFDDLISLAFDNPPTGDQICFTVTYRKGPKQNPEGVLASGQCLKVKKGMVFDVTATDKS